jgi:SNF2 family DNA or RNA helicase
MKHEPLSSIVQGGGKRRQGIDLQERCANLIHVDLPWNPMRLHQRVGRLNRYGQTRLVTAFNLRNPDTVESRIWDKLNEKLARITHALAGASVQEAARHDRRMAEGLTRPAVVSLGLSEWL